MSKKMVTPRCGQPFEVDTSDEVCGKFGFKHGDRIVDNNNGKKGTVMGVASSRYAEETLWYALDCDDGKVSFSEPFKEGDLTLLSA